MRHLFDGSAVLAAPRDVVWAHVLDPHTMAECIPGAESVTAVDDTHYRVISALGVGFLRLRLLVDLEIFDLVPPQTARMRAHGNAPGSRVDVLTAIALEAVDPRRTGLVWTAETEVHGALVGMGRRIVEWAGRRFTEDFWESFVRRVDSADRPR